MCQYTSDMLRSLLLWKDDKNMAMFLETNPRGIGSASQPSDGTNGGGLRDLPLNLLNAWLSKAYFTVSTLSY